MTLLTGVIVQLPYPFSFYVFNYKIIQTKTVLRHDYIQAAAAGMELGRGMGVEGFGGGGGGGIY